MMRLIDETYLDRPYFGSRRMAEWLHRNHGIEANRKRVQRLMRTMGLEAIYPKKSSSQPDKSHKIFPYLLRNVTVNRVNQVWSTDITYVPLRRGFMYLVAVMDWYSRYVLSWRLSNSLDIEFCLDALDDALEQGTPEIFNTDQGAQFTSQEFTNRILKRGIAVSMDGRGRALDNAFIERLWRTVKYEEIYLKEHANVDELRNGLGEYFKFYAKQRPHQGLDYRTPHEVYHSSLAIKN